MKTNFDAEKALNPALKDRLDLTREEESVAGDLMTNIDAVLNPRGFSQLRLLRSCELSVPNTTKVKNACGNEDPTLEDLYRTFLKPGTDREFFFGKRKGIGAKSEAAIIQAFLEDQIIIEKEDGTYEFHPRVFNALPAEWIAVVLDTDERVQLGEFLGLNDAEMSELTFLELQAKTHQALSALGSRSERTQLIELLEKSGFAYLMSNRIEWNPNFRRELNTEVYGLDLYKELSERMLLDIEKGLHLGNLAGPTARLLTVFDHINPFKKRDMTLEESLNLMTSLRLRRDAALRFLKALVESGYAQAFGLAESEHEKPAEILEKTAQRTAEAKAARDLRLAEVSRIAAEATKAVMQQRKRVGITLSVHPEASINADKLDPFDARTALQNILFPALAAATGKTQAELTTADLFSFLGGEESFSAGTRRVDLSKFTSLPGVAKGRTKMLVKYLLSSDFIVPISGEADDDELDREYDFHPRVYNEELGAWIAVRASEDEFKSLAEAFGLSTQELLDLNFEGYREITSNWRALLAGKSKDEKAAIRQILNRSGRFHFRNNGFYGEPQLLKG